MKYPDETYSEEYREGFSDGMKAVAKSINEQFGDEFKTASQNFVSFAHFLNALAVSDERSEESSALIN